MTDKLPKKYIPIDKNSVYTSKVPSSRDWKSFAKNLLYIKGTSKTIIPQNELRLYSSIGTTSHFEMPIFQTKQALDKYWYFGVKCLGEAGQVSIQVSGSSPIITLASFFGSDIVVRHQLEDQGAALDQELQIVPITASTTIDKDAKITSFACYEPPRVVMDSNNADEGVARVSSFEARQPIFGHSGNAPFNSVRAIGYHLSGAVQDVRRPGLYGWMGPYWKDGQINTNLPTVPYQGELAYPSASISIPIQPRRIYRNIEENPVTVVIGFTCTNTVLPHLMLTSSNNTETYVWKDTDFFGNSIDAASTSPRYITGTINMACDGCSGSALPNGMPKMDELFINIANVPEGDGGVMRICSVLIGEPYKAY